MDSTTFYNLSTGGYLLSLALFAVHVVNTRSLILRMGIIAIALSFLVQTGGMVLRWAEAGFLEVAAAERAVGQVLSGWSWFVVFTQHPPWSNLYEIMVYMSWGIVMVTLIFEMKWQLAWLRQVGIILALLALGMASLTDATIKPLVPALKSWWIMIHVISASIAYAAGVIAAFICLFALIKDEARVSRPKLLGAALVFFGILLFALSGGLRLFKEQAYLVKLLANAGENVVNVMDMSKEQALSYLVPMPYVGYSLMAAILIHLALGLLLYSDRISWMRKNQSLIFIVGFLSSIVTLLLIFWVDTLNTAIVLESAGSHHLSPAGPWFISFKSHPWSLGLLLFVVFLEAIFILYLFKPSWLTDKLPSVLVLETASYKAISLSFFLMTIVLVTGALWAHYAWGRYWAWDPKETGALAIWATYVIYLHARRTSGLSGPACSVIGFFGLFVIIIGFLGVNLGLFADGLHTYGNS